MSQADTEITPEKQAVIDLFNSISKRRKELNITQIELAQRVGWKDGSRLSRIEKGQIAPSPAIWEKFAEILGLSLPEVLPTEAPFPFLVKPGAARKTVSATGDEEQKRTPHRKTPQVPNERESIAVKGAFDVWQYDQKADTLTYKTYTGISVVVPVSEIRQPHLLIQWIRHIIAQNWANDREVSGFIKAAFSIIP